MMNFLRRLGGYLLARAQERSTVAGVVAVGMTLLGVVLPADMVGGVVTAVVSIAGVLAMLVPGGR